MLYLDITGYNARRRRCSSVVSWFLSKYLPRHHITVEVLHRGLLREGVYGWCSVTDCDWRPRSFLIELHNRLNEEDYIKTLLHECVHILQHIRGDLRDKRGIRCWKGIDCSNLDYEEMPWEREAHKMEKELYNEYLGLNDFVYSFPNRLTQP
jgi:hypothetical protein